MNEQHTEETRLHWYERMWFRLFRSTSMTPTVQQQRILEEQEALRDEFERLRHEFHVPRRRRTRA